MITQATTTDIPALLDLENTCFHGLHCIPGRQFRYLLTKAKAITIVLKENSQLQGYAILLTPERKTLARIYSLAVYPHLRGKGIATQLLQDLEERAKALGYQMMSLEVREDNSGAIKLYEKHGYHKVKALKNFDDDGATAWRMRKRLGESHA